jgi:metallophosphoesterase (TIGR00282 family)
MRILFLGDVVGRAGRNAVIEQLPRLRERYRLDFVVVNGENAAGGFGITEQILTELLDAGADVVTTGNHVFDQRETLVFIERYERLLRPINFPPGTPGKGAGLFKARTGAEILVVNVQGRVFMADLDDPFRAVERELEACALKTGADAILIDFHAEATSEKEAMGHFADGRATAVIGTHTHVPTADEQVLPKGTAYISDAGMCGDFDSILGMDKEEPLQRFLTRIPNARFAPSLGEATLCGVAVDVDDRTGLARAIAPLRLGGRLSQAQPAFWLEGA